MRAAWLVMVFSAVAACSAQEDRGAMGPASADGVPATSAAPTSAAPTSAAPTSAAPTSAAPTSAAPPSAAPTSAAPSDRAQTLYADVITLALDAKGHYLAGGDLGGRVWLWDLRRDRRMLVKAATPLGNRIGQVAIGPGPTPVSGAFGKPDRPWRVWSAETGTATLSMGPAGVISGALALSADAASLVTLARRGQTAQPQLWDLSSGKMTWQGAAYQGTGGTVAVAAGASRWAVAAQGRLSMFSRGAAEPVWTHEVEPAPALLAFEPSAKGPRLIAASGSSIRRWDVATGEAAPGLTLETDTRPVVALRATKESSIAVTRGDAGLSLWSARDGARLRTLAGPCRCETEALSDDGSTVACGCAGSSRIHLWRAEH